MTFRNKDKVPFIDCTPEQQLEIIRAKKEGRCERLFSFASHGWEAAKSKEIMFNGIYRTKQRKTVINWGMIPEEFKWFSFDKRSSCLDFWAKKPFKGNCNWFYRGFENNVNTISKDVAKKIVQLGDEPWDESLQQRPE